MRRYFKRSRTWIQRRWRNAIDKVHKRFFDRQFDRREGVATTGKVVMSDPTAAHWHAGNYDYLPTPSAAFRMIIGSLPIDRSKYVFVDLGAGKGRGLLLAARMGFKRVEGVEISEALAEAARANLAAALRPTAGDSPTRVTTADAATYEFPHDSLVIYLFNPFGEDVLTEVVERLRRSLLANPRDCWVVYFYPRKKQVFDNSHIFRKATRPLLWKVVDLLTIPGDLAIYRVSA